MQKVNNTKQKIVKFVGVLLVFYAVLPVSHSLAYTSSIVDNGDNLVVSVNDFDYTGYPCVEGFPPFNMPVVGYQINVFENTGAPYDQDFPTLSSPVYTGDSVSTFYNTSDLDVIAVLMSCVPQNSGDQYYSETLASGFTFDPFAFPDSFVYNTLYTITGSANSSVFYDSDAAPSGPGSYTPPHFNLVGTTSDFIASVSGSLRDGVQHTGSNIWPMFAFVGVSLAFIIALQLLVFTKRATGVNKSNLDGSGAARGRKNPYRDPMHPDHVAFERGERENLKDGIDLFPDDKK